MGVELSLKVSGEIAGIGLFFARLFYLGVRRVMQTVPAPYKKNFSEDWAIKKQPSFDGWIAQDMPKNRAFEPKNEVC